MHRNNNHSPSYLKNFIILYFERLIRINHEKQNSLIFILSVQILRFLLGHTFAYCVFMIQMLDHTDNGKFYSGLKTYFLYGALSNYHVFRALSIAWLCLEILFILGFFLKQQWQQRFNIVRVLYFMMKYSKISCEFIYCIFGITFYAALKHNDYFMIIILVIQMIIGLVLFKITAIYEQKNLFQSLDAYTHNHNLGVELTNLVFCILTFLGTLIVLFETPQFFRTIIILLWTALQLVRLSTTVIYPYYQMPITHFVYSLGVCLQTAQLTVETILHFTMIEMISNNALWLIGILTLFLFQGIRNFNNHLVEQSYFVNVEDIKSDQEFYLIINSYYTAFQNLKQNNNTSDICLIVSSIRRDHQNSCKDPSCYCQTDKQLKDFLKHYLLNILNKLEEVFSSNHMIMLFIYSFKFHVYEQYISIHQQLERLDKIKQMGWLELLLSMALKYKLKKWIDQKNKQYKVIRICLAIRLEEDMSILNQIIIEDIEIRYKKWNSFSKQLSRMEEIRNMSNKELMNYIKIENIKKTKWEDYRQSPIFNLILYFYFRRIALKNDDLAMLEKNIKELNRKIKEEELNKLTLFSKYLFHHNACTVEISIRQINIGTIINTSKSIFRLFGYSSKRIIGQNISILIPHFLAKQYSQRLKNWVDHGQTIKNISTVSQAYCLHKNNLTFLSLQYCKIYPTIDQITLITTFFLKNDNDLILISDKGTLQGYGKGMNGILKNLPHRIDCDFVFKNMKKKLSNGDFQEQKSSKTIVFNQSITSQFLNGKRFLMGSSNQTKIMDSQEKKKSKKLDSVRKQSQLNKQSTEELFISRIQTKPQDRLDVNKETNQLLNQSTFEYDNVWKINFLYKKQRFETQQFFKVQMKGLQQIKNFEDYVSKNEQGMEMASLKGQQGQSDKIVEDDEQNMNIEEQQNSSMASFTSQLGYGISKLVTHFTFILLNPNKLEDKRMKKKFLLEILFTFSLIGILSATLVINKYSLDEKTTQLKAKSYIDRTFHLLEVSTNHAFNMYSYRNDPETQKIVFEQLKWDTKTFESQLNRQFQIINQQITPLNGQILYDYLKTPTKWTFQNSGLYQCQLLIFFKLNFHLFWDIRNDVINDSSMIEHKSDSFRLLNMNTPQLRIVRDYLTSITEGTLEKNDKFNTIYLIVSLVFFVFFSSIFGLYINSYFKYRFDQNEDHLQLYQMIPADVLRSLTDYYAAYYKHYVMGKLRIDSSLDEEKKLFQLEMEENTQTQQVSVNKVKLVGRKKYLRWMGVLLVFLLLNGGNIIISYNMYLFNQEVQFFSKLTNYLSSSESILLSRWIRLKSQYYFDRDNFNMAYLDFLLSYIDSLDVKFGTYATFEQNWVTASDPNFRLSFNKLLTTSPCILNEAQYSKQQLEICNRQSYLSKNGLITFVNGFSRTMRNTILYWKKNFDSIMSQPDYIATLTQFKEFDMTLTFHVDTFNKLNYQITSVYQSGFNSQYRTYLVIFVLLIVLLSGSFLWSLYCSYQDKIALSYLYGYALLFPAFALKQSKYLLKFIQTNLQFSQKH